MVNRHTPEKELIELGKECERCGHCCRYGAGFVLDEEIKPMALHLNMEEDEFREAYLDEFEKFNTKLHRFRLVKKDAPYGRCIFLKDNKCTIQEVKPLHCRIGSCKEHGDEANEWFIVNHFVNPADPESIRQWHTRLKIKPTIEGGEIESLVPKEETRNKMMNREI